jgi:hypothetical protein
MFWILPALVLPVLAIQNIKKQYDEKKNAEFMANFVHKLVIKNENRRKDTMERIDKILKELD